MLRRLVPVLMLLTLGWNGAWAADPTPQATPQESVALWRAGAEKGVTEDQLALAHAYTQGYGVDADLTAATRWFRAAAEAGNAEAQYRLGLAYTQGNGVDPDPREAVRWWLKAAEGGALEAQAKLGFLYATGRGVERDLVQAYRWFALAARADGNGKQGEKGELEWGSYRDEVAQQLSPEQLAEAQRLVAGAGGER